MSSRAIRKAQADREKWQTRLQAGQDHDDENEASEDEDTSFAGNKQSAFALLGETGAESGDESDGTMSQNHQDNECAILSPAPLCTHPAIVSIGLIADTWMKHRCRSHR